MAKQREIVGVFLRERHAFISTDGLTRTIIGEIEIDVVPNIGPLDKEVLTIKGEAAENELSSGLCYRFYGYSKPYLNKRTGQSEDQFCFDSFVVEKPAGQEAVTTYLQQCDGIGPVKARKLWERHQDDAIRFLREQPDDAADEVKIPYESARAAAELLTQRLCVEKTTVELYGLLHGRGLPKFKKLVDKIIMDYGSEAALVIRRNPYLLMRYRGCGFMKTHAIYLEFGHSPKRLKSQTLCAWYAIASDSRGDTWFRLSDARDALRKSIAGDDVRLEDAIALGLRAGLLAERTESNGQRWIAEKKKADAEGWVARFIDLAREESIENGMFWPSLELLRGVVTPHQWTQLELALKAVVCILAGSPGTGKTYCAAALIRLVIQMVGSNQVAACAPTGKAAVRLTEGLQANGVTMKATTIHSLLQVQQADAGTGDGWGFRYGQAEPLPFQFVFIDESSMLDVSLMASLLAARGRGCHFLFIGDPNQLAPVGHGAPLRDFISFGLPTGTLTKIERNDGLIVRACAEIRDYKRFSPAVKPNLDIGDNLALFERETPEETIETLTGIMGRFIQSQKYDPIWDVQIIVAVNKKSPLGRKPLNEKLQDLLNPDGERVKGNPFRVGDKIINQKNAWFPAADGEHSPGANQDGKLYVANGEQAEVIRVDTNRTWAKLTAPDREILIPRGNRDADESDAAGGDKKDDEEDTGTGCNWELGFAISGHKSQGSEWPVVIVVIDDYNGAKMVQSKNWIYTAISRAKDLCLMIGRKATALDSCKRDALFKRKTFLVERLKELAAVERKPLVNVVDASEQSPFSFTGLERGIQNMEAGGRDLFDDLMEGILL